MSELSGLCDPKIHQIHQDDAADSWGTELLFGLAADGGEASVRETIRFAAGPEK